MARMMKPRHRGGKRYLSLLLTFVLIAGNVPARVAHSDDEPVPGSAVQAAEPTPAQLQQLVAPVALYPDELVAQVLAAATYPEEIVEADRWLQEHPGLQGDTLAQQVDAQPWDPSVKALTQFPSVLANMDKNLSWTSALGDAYVNHQQEVMDAVQTMRRRAKNAGNLETTSEQNVVDQGSDIQIAPANPEVVYVPAYDPWLVYGPPVVAWPGWYPYPGLFVATPGLVFGVGFGIGFLGGFGWGWDHWGCDWHHRTVVYNHNTYVSRSRTFFNRQTFARERAGFGRDGGARGPGSFRGAREDRAGGGFPRDGEGHTLGSYRGPGGASGSVAREGGARTLGSYHGPGDAGSRSAAGFGGAATHGFGAPRSAPQGQWGAFSGFDHGAATRGMSQRGFSSVGGVRGGGFGGGGGFHGGGGGGHGGGGHR